jgi:hypothetical protein
MSVDYTDRLYNQGALFAGGCKHYSTCNRLLAMILYIYIYVCVTLSFFLKIFLYQVVSVRIMTETT